MTDPTCIHGWPTHMGLACCDCDAETEQACREFDAMVARGDVDEAGYTPAERKAKERRAKERRETA